MHLKWKFVYNSAGYLCIQPGGKSLEDNSALLILEHYKFFVVLKKVPSKSEAKKRRIQKASSTQRITKIGALEEIYSSSSVYKIQ